LSDMSDLQDHISELCNDLTSEKVYFEHGHIFPR
jgi:hypothetical protein